MAEQAYLDLFYAPDADTPLRFFELRRFGNQVWTAEGAADTFGESNLVICNSADDAERLSAQLISEKTAQAFVRTRSVIYSPSSFDYAAFTAEVTLCLEAFWRNLAAQHPAVRFDRLAISTDPDAETISAYANQSAPDDEDYALYNPQEWPYESKDGAFDIVYRLMMSKMRDIPFEEIPPHHDDGLLECMIRALENLRRMSLFSSELLLWVDISDSGQIAGMVNRLNSNDGAGELNHFFGWDADRYLEVSF
jgi:Domain of unknown function (DUF4303)